MNRLALHAHHELSGAVFVSRDGWEVPASYAFGDAEVLDARRATGVIDLSDRAKVRVSGPDRTTFLDSLVTGDVASVSPSRALRTLLLTEKGKVVGDLRVLAHGDAYVLDIDPLVATGVVGSIEKHLVSDDVVLEPMQGAHIGVHGPTSAALASRAIGRELPGLAVDGVLPVQLDSGALAWLLGSDYTGSPGLDIVSFEDTLGGLWRRLVGIGATPFGREALETLRIEAGRPRAGVDMDANTIALEARLEPWIDYRKGCYLGQETIARVTYQGHMNRYLVGLAIEGDLVPDPRERLTSLEGKEVGFVTSATYSPTVRRVIALGYVRVGHHEPGTRLHAERAGWNLRAEVVSVPFFRRG